MKNKYLFLLVAALLFSSSAYASVGTQEDGVEQAQATDINFTTNLDLSSDGSKSTVSVSSSPTFAGNVLFNTTLYANGRFGASSTIPSSSNGINPSALPYSLLLKSVGAAAGETATLPNGTSGQILAIQIVGLQTGGTWRVTPTRSSGFRSILFDTFGDTVLLQYDTTLGWIILNNGGAVVTPVTL